MNVSAKFIDQNRSDFFPVLRKRVNQYFKDNDITRFGNGEMVLKSIILISTYLGAYLVILLLPVNPWFLLPLAVLMGIAMAGIGMSVMHDALHGSYSKKTSVNRWMGYMTYFIGANPFVWKVQHNVFHHTYTNIHEHDEDRAVDVRLGEANGVGRADLLLLGHGAKRQVRVLSGQPRLDRGRQVAGNPYDLVHSDLFELANQSLAVNAQRWTYNLIDIFDSEVHLSLAMWPIHKTKRDKWISAPLL